MLLFGVIKSFKDGRTKDVWERKKTKYLPDEILKQARRKLGFLEDAMTLNDLRVPPGNRLESLKGDRRKQFSIRINDQWRICFRWEDTGAYDVEIVDYHK
jgi:proteic killer suppression protein